MSNGKFAEEGSLLLILECIKDKPKFLGLGIPSVKLNNYLKLEASHKQIERRIYRTVFETEAYVGNERLKRDLSALEWIASLVQPDSSITTKRTGKVLGYSISYYGIKNIFSVEKNIGVSASGSLPYISHFGSDPISEVNLYGNENVRFNSIGGKEAPSAAAFYDLNSKALRLQDTASKSELFRALIRNAT